MIAVPAEWARDEEDIFTMACESCGILSARVTELEEWIELLGDSTRLLRIVEEYADVLAESGKILNTPAAKRQFITNYEPE